MRVKQTNRPQMSCMVLLDSVEEYLSHEILGVIVYKITTK